MALKGKPPETIIKRAKVFIYGETNTGKSRELTKFPLGYYIDCEKGSENDMYTANLKASKSHYYFTNDLDDITNEILSLSKDKHPFQNLIIDPITVPYLLDCDAEAERLQRKDGKDGTEFGRNQRVPKRKMRRIFQLAFRLDMNVFITAHLKNDWKDQKIVGTTFDADQKIDYMFDLIIEVVRRGDKSYGIVRKTRVGGFKIDGEFPFEYNEIVNRYGREIFERESVPIALISEGTAKQIRELLDARKDGDDLLEKVLKKADIDVLEDATQEFGEKFIEVLTKTGGKNVAVS